MQRLSMAVHQVMVPGPRRINASSVADTLSIPFFFGMRVAYLARVPLRM